MTIPCMIYKFLDREVSNLESQFVSHSICLENRYPYMVSNSIVKNYSKYLLGE